MVARCIWATHPDREKLLLGSTENLYGFSYIDDQKTFGVVVYIDHYVHVNLHPLRVTLDRQQEIP